MSDQRKPNDERQRPTNRFASDRVLRIFPYRRFTFGRFLFWEEENRRKRGSLIVRTVEYSFRYSVVSLPRARTVDRIILDSRARSLVRVAHVQ